MNTSLPRPGESKRSRLLCVKAGHDGRQAGLTRKHRKRSFASEEKVWASAQASACRAKPTWTALDAAGGAITGTKAASGLELGIDRFTAFIESPGN